MIQRVPVVGQDHIDHMCKVVSNLKSGNTFCFVFKQELSFNLVFQGRLRRLLSFHTKDGVIEFDDQSMLVISLALNELEWGNNRSLTVKIRDDFCPSFLMSCIGWGYFDSVEIVQQT